MDPDPWASAMVFQKQVKKTDPQIKHKNRGGLRTARIDPSRRGGIDGFDITANGATRTRNGPKPSEKSKNGPKIGGAAPNSYGFPRDFLGIPSLLSA